MIYCKQNEIPSCGVKHNPFQTGKDIEGEGDFFAVVVGVRTGVYDHLGVVYVEFVPSPCQGRVCRIGHIDNVQPAIEGVGAHAIDELRLGVGDHIVRAPKARVQRGHGQF